MPEISPTIVRRVLNNTRIYDRVLEIRRADKLSISAPVTNTSELRVATTKDPDANSYDELRPGDSLLWESTVAGQQLSWTVYVLPTIVNDVVIVTVWR